LLFRQKNVVMPFQKQRVKTYGTISLGIVFYGYEKQSLNQLSNYQIFKKDTSWSLLHDTESTVIIFIMTNIWILGRLLSSGL
jgi:hypothetical protein